MELPHQPGAGPETTGNQEPREQLDEQRPRIYVASLTDYNSGILHGTWIDADQEADELYAAVNGMLARSPSDQAEEFAVHDFEHFGDYDVHEYDSLDWISRVARGISENGLAFAAWAQRCDHDEDELADFEQAYLGEWESRTQYATELLEDLGYVHAIENVVPDGLQPYVRIDFDAFARDLELNDEITVVEHAGGVWIFEGEAVRRATL